MYRRRHEPLVRALYPMHVHTDVNMWFRRELHRWVSSTLDVSGIFTFVQSRPPPLIWSILLFHASGAPVVVISLVFQAYILSSRSLRPPIRPSIPIAPAVLWLEIRLDSKQVSGKQTRFPSQILPSRSRMKPFAPTNPNARARCACMAHILSGK
jgi:hypothetical protein